MITWVIDEGLTQSWITVEHQLFEWVNRGLSGQGVVFPNVQVHEGAGRIRHPK